VRLRLLAPLAAVALPAALAAQELPAPEAPPAASAPRFRLFAELKVGFRDSRDLISPIFTPFPGVVRPVPPEQRTVDPGTSLELDTVNLRVDGTLAKDVTAKVEIHFLDLYNRNPTSSGDRVVVREAWLRFGGSLEPLSDEGRRPYVLVGLAPRFSKEVTRHLESYGMWGTAVGRFEEPQVQVGVPFGEHVYAKAMLGNGNPLFLRDTNALAGDNGTPERVPGSPNRVYETGLPILYDAKPQDVSFDRLEWGAGAGVRFGHEGGAGVDVLGWFFTRRLQDSAAIHGSALPGELDVLRGEGYPLPFHGTYRREWGVNVQARVLGFRLFAQWVDQDLAGLVRRGYEAELAYIQPIPPYVRFGETILFTFVQPVLRLSYIDNRFEGQFQYPSLSVLWDWLKIDAGIRIGIVRDVDVTIEYSRHDAETPVGTIHPDEFLTVLRIGFSR
jgi:hypothetical protein